MVRVLRPERRKGFIMSSDPRYDQMFARVLQEHRCSSIRIGHSDVYTATLVVVNGTRTWEVVATGITAYQALEKALEALVILREKGTFNL